MWVQVPPSLQQVFFEKFFLLYKHISKATVKLLLSIKPRVGGSNPPWSLRRSVAQLVEQRSQTYFINFLDLVLRTSGRGHPGLPKDGSYHRQRVENFIKSRENLGRLRNCDEGKRLVRIQQEPPNGRQMDARVVCLAYSCRIITKRINACNEFWCTSREPDN